MSELLGGLQGLLEDRVGRIWISGEISNLHEARSGHAYFTLKDERGQIRAALFRGAAQRLRFRLEEGLEVHVYADVGIYEARGDLQLVVRRVEPVGQGALQLAYEQLRARLEAEGLFDEGRKRPLPEHPHRVGVVTSPTSAAVRDVIHVSGRRSPGTPLLISPTRVQGEGAGEEVAAAIALLAGRGEVDVILLVRGGGSLEDLWAFNSESVARAMAACPVPVISGVGHETDFTIADFVADARAPTPSAAAALALPDRSALVAQLRRDWLRLCAAMRAQLRARKSAHDRERAAQRLLAPRARLAAQRVRVERALRAMAAAAQALHARRRRELAGLAGRLDALSPLAVLGRGYALATRESDGRVVKMPSDLDEGEVFSLRLAEGHIRARREADGADGEG